MKRICAGCGRSIPAGSTFCPYCGRKTESSDRTSSFCQRVPFAAAAAGAAVIMLAAGLILDPQSHVTPVYGAYGNGADMQLTIGKDVSELSQNGTVYTGSLKVIRSSEVLQGDLKDEEGKSVSLTIYVNDQSLTVFERISSSQAARYSLKKVSE